MRGKYKSKKMLFFIVLLFVIIQVVTIIGLAKETNDDITDASIENINSLENLMTTISKIEGIMSLVSNDQELVTENPPTTPTKVLEMIEITDGNSDTGATAETTPSNTDVSPSSSASTNTPPNNSVDSGSDSSANEGEKLIEQEPTILLTKIGYASIFTTPKPELSIEILNYASPGDKVEVLVTSEGQTVANAKVTFIGTSLTDNCGIAYFKIPELLKTGKYFVTAKKDEYKTAIGLMEIGKKQTEFMAPYINQPSDRILTLSSILNTWNSFLGRVLV